jgi:hypothetical protein
MPYNPETLKNLRPGQSPGRTPGRTPPTTLVSVRVPDELLALIDASADHHGRKRSAEIIAALTEQYSTGTQN